jgi:aldehyde:ferredoxin oxidoreductase
VMDAEKFEQMKDEYYDIRGWDKTTGVPSREKLEALGLGDVAEEVLPTL